MRRLIVVIIVLFILSGCSIKISEIAYEYVDTNNNTGTAKACYTTYGNLTCRLDDGTKIKVISYKPVEREQ